MLTAADAVGASSVAVDVLSVVRAVDVSSVVGAVDVSSVVGAVGVSSVARAGGSSAPVTVWRPSVGSAAVIWAC